MLHPVAVSVKKFRFWGWILPVNSVETGQIVKFGHSRILWISANSTKFWNPGCCDLLKLHLHSKELQAELKHLHDNHIQNSDVTFNSAQMYIHNVRKLLSSPSLHYIGFKHSINIAFTTGLALSKFCTHSLLHVMSKQLQVFSPKYVKN
jgi:hypothetical protein